MCGTADTLMVTKYVQYRWQFNGDTICVVQQTVLWWQNMCGTGDSLMVTQYVRYSWQFNGDTICVVQQTV